MSAPQCMIFIYRPKHISVLLTDMGECKLGTQSTSESDPYAYLS